MSAVARWKWFVRKHWLAVLACGPLAVAGCAGENSEPVETASTTPAAGTDSPGTPAATHGGSAGSSSAPADSHGTSETAPDAGHGGAASNGGPGAGYDSTMSSGGPGAGHGSAVSSGGPGAGHGGGVTSGGPSAGHGSAVSSGGPAAGHGGGVTSGGPGAGHGGGGSSDGPAGVHGVPMPGDDVADRTADENNVGDQKVSTGEWLSGLASGVLGSNGAAGEAAATPEGLPSPGDGQEGTVTTPEGATGGGGKIQQFEEGTAEYAVQQLVLKLQAGDTQGVADLISERTTESVLKSLREGDPDTATLEKVKTMVADAKLVSMRDGPGQKSFVVRNSAGQMLRITAKREGDVYKIFSVKVAPPPRGRR